MPTPLDETSLPFLKRTPYMEKGVILLAVQDMFPLRRNGKPAGRGWFGQHRDKTLTLDQARDHAAKRLPFAFRTGRLHNGDICCAVDCDLKRGINGVANFLTWAGEQFGHFDINDLVHQATNSGGLHILFPLDGGTPEANAVAFRNAVNTIPGVDIRAEGGFIRLYAPCAIVCEPEKGMERGKFYFARSNNNDPD